MRRPRTANKQLEVCAFFVYPYLKLLLTQKKSVDDMTKTWSFEFFLTIILDFSKKTLSIDFD